MIGFGEKLQNDAFAWCMITLITPLLFLFARHIYKEYKLFKEFYFDVEKNLEKAIYELIADPESSEKEYAMFKALYAACGAGVFYKVLSTIYKSEGIEIPQEVMALKNISTFQILQGLHDFNVHYKERSFEAITDYRQELAITWANIVENLNALPEKTANNFKKLMAEVTKNPIAGAYPALY